MFIMEFFLKNGLKVRQTSSFLVPGVLLISTCLLGAVGCVKSEKQETIPKSSGTWDGAGGNVVDGRPIEDFIKSIDKLSEYQGYVAPVLRGIQRKSPDFYQLLMDTVKGKKWYFLPVELNALSPAEIGVYFESNQRALQTRRSVWISSIVYDKMKPDDRALLLIHEFLIGLKILNAHDAGLIPGFDPLKLIKIKPEDYEAVRNVAHWLMYEMNDHSPEEFVAVLRDHGFGDFAAAIEGPKSIWMDRTFSKIELHQFFESRYELNTLPQYCPLAIDGESKALNVDFRSIYVDGAPLRLRLTLLLDGGVYDELEFDLEGDAWHTQNDSQGNASLELYERVNASRFKAKRVRLKVVFDATDLSDLVFQRQILLLSSGSIGLEWFDLRESDQNRPKNKYHVY